MKYFVTIETLRIIAVDANSEDEAIEIVKTGLDNQDPRNTAKLGIAKEILVSEQINVDVANDGKEALEKILMHGSTYYDIILMDIQMPIMDGYEATKEIRKLGYSMPIIAMTANAFDDDKKQALKIGMNDHIAKPLDVNFLYSLLVKYLQG